MPHSAKLAFCHCAEHKPVHSILNRIVLPSVHVLSLMNITTVAEFTVHFF